MVNQRRSLFAICFISAIKEGFFILWAPFFPKQLAQRGISDYYYAPIFTSYSVFLLLASFFAGNLMSKWGRKNTMRVGNALQAVASLLFIVLNWVYEPLTFCIMSLLGRILQGIGAGLMQTAALGEATA